MMHAELSDDDVPDEGDADADADPTKEGGKKGKKPAAVPTADPWEIVTECEGEKFKPSATDLKMLKLVTVKEDRLAYIRQQKGLSAATDPASKSRQQIADGDGKNKDGNATAKESGNGNQPATGVEEARGVMAQLSKDLRGAA